MSRVRRWLQSTAFILIAFSSASATDSALKGLIWARGRVRDGVKVRVGGRGRGRGRDEG